jgi:D-serine deaminase-like pyridoxal phosphate-dependent protein
LSDHARSWLEVARILDGGDVNGIICREELPTPALLLDLDAFEFNVQKMMSHVCEHNKTLRPHGKAHKSPEIAKYLITAGAVGACVAKLSEAEVFAEHGVGGLLVTTPVIGKYKIERALSLAKIQPDTILCVDNAQNVLDFSDAAVTRRLFLNLAIDLWIGRRTGVEPGAPSLALAQLIDSSPNVRFAGIQAYAGHASQVVGWEERRKTSRESMRQALDTKQLIEKNGMNVPLLTGGSTGTYDIDSQIEGMTELQPGSFIFMDVAYRRIGGKDGPVYQDFRNALSVLTTVISKPSRDIAVVDAGFKAFSTDQPVTPESKSAEGVVYRWAGDEHGILDLSQASQPLNVGSTVEFVIPHCDPTVNLYDRIFCLRGDTVEQVWSVAARGKCQ